MKIANKTSIAAITGMAIAFMAAPGPASALSILASSTKNSADRGAVVGVDPTSGARTIVGDPTGGSEGLTGLELDGARNLWGTTINGFGSTIRLLQIDAGTGALINDVGFIQMSDSYIRIRPTCPAAASPSATLPMTPRPTACSRLRRIRPTPSAAAISTP